MTLTVTLDGVDVSDVVQEATSQHLLNRKYVGTCKIPVAQAFELSDGAKLKIEDSALTGLGQNPIDFHGLVKFESAEDGEEGDGLVEYTAESAREIWEWRPARDGPSDPDDPGNYISPDFLDRLLKGPLVMQDVLLQSNDGSDPALGEGPMAMTFGSFPSTGIDISGAPMSTPLTIEQLAVLLSSTGEVDVVETMIDAGGNTSQIDCFNGNYGTDRSATVIYTYEPDGNVRNIKRTRDMSKLANKIRYLLGPRVTDERWRRSIEASNTDIPDTSTYTEAALVAAIMQSRIDWLVRADIRIYDTFNNESDAVPLYWRLWQDESMWRLQPRVLYTVKPTEGSLPSFDIGDLVGVGAFAGFMGGFTGSQRVFGRKITWDVDGVPTLAEIQTSADSEALS